jgi:general secretion pathway protein D
MQRLRISAAALAAALMIVTHASGQERPPPNRPAGGPDVTVAFPPPAPPPESALRRDNSVEIEDLLARVAASTGKKFLVDPRIRARVLTVPLIEKPTYAELLSILRMHGFAAFELGGRVNIIPDANARFMPSRLLQRDDPSVPDDEYVTRVIKVANAVQLVPVLRPLMPASAHLAATTPPEGQTGESQLILFDTYANVRRMTEIINTLAR